GDAGDGQRRGQQADQGDLRSAPGEVNVLTDRHRERLLGYALIAPVAIFLAGLVAYPFLSAIYLSLTEKTVGYPAHFVGLRNYETLLESGRFRIVAWYSAAFTVGSIAATLALGF